MLPSRIAAIAASLLCLTTFAIASPTEQLSARRHHHSRVGACDGFHRCRCGVTAANKAGLPLNYNGFNLKRAVEWIKAFPRTAIHAGAVGYVRRGGPSGHVFTVVSYNGGPTATVYDDAGTYERRIDNAVFVSPSGGSRSRHSELIVPTIY